MDDLVVAGTQVQEVSPQLLAHARRAAEVEVLRIESRAVALQKSFVNQAAVGKRGVFLREDVDDLVGAQQGFEFGLEEDVIRGFVGEKQAVVADLVLGKEVAEDRQEGGDPLRRRR